MPRRCDGGAAASGGGVTFDGLRALCRMAVSDGVVPGLVVAVGSAGRTVFLEGFGERALAPDRAPAGVDTVYDLASLTKPLVTSVLAMQSVERGALGLDAPVAAYVPAFQGEDRRGITVRQLLAHAAGLPAHRPYYERALAAPAADRRSMIVRLAATEPLAYAPGERSLYSDLGFILLGEALELVTATRLDRLAARDITGRLALRDTAFVPIGEASPLVGRAVAPTERCPVRGRLVSGEVHDLNAFAMGGVAGHAGLFGTAADVAAIALALCAAWRDAGTDGGQPLVGREVVREFWRPAGVPGSLWRLGWDGPATGASLAGARIARRAVGHLAFTGCSLWIDPERESFVVVLSNRVHPAVTDDPRFRALRPALNDAALEGLGYRE